MNTYIKRNKLEELNEILDEKFFSSHKILEMDFGHYPPYPLKNISLPDNRIRTIHEKSFYGKLKNILIKALSLKPSIKLYGHILFSEFITTVKQQYMERGVHIKSKLITNGLTKLACFALLLCSPLFLIRFLKVKKVGPSTLAYVHPVKTKEIDYIFFTDSSCDENLIGRPYKTLSHENIHILQLWDDPLRLLNDNAATLKSSQKNMGLQHYYNKNIEIEAHLHESIKSIYACTQKLPLQKNEFLVLLYFCEDIGFHFPKELDEKLFDFFITLAIKSGFQQKTISTIMSSGKEDINASITPLEYLESETDKLNYIFSELPKRYAKLLELYGDKKAAEQFRSSLDINFTID